MSGYDTDPESGGNFPPVRQLTKPQRRAFGVLIEKAFTVPESYPMTLKGVTVGCNQKSNRAPLTNYSEDAVLEALEQLREMGLVAVVHTESGRTERYRHYARKRFPFTEPQLAIITELLLRGSQQLGELRARASRMVPIESLQDLRTELDALLEQGYIRSGGSLDRRGAEVDHNFHVPSEAVPALGGGSDVATPGEQEDRPATRAVVTSSAGASDDLRQQLAAIREENQSLRSELQELRQTVSELQDNLTSLRQSLGA
ncbi:DUF480 domain-containing protein [Planctomicrobium sp. SH664]|uniref:DUF480 domain-containing protein n=1 Tax=Planctomicrobium sp. SH664 TaxID=3448125 RepID=UPI003F5C1EEE